MLRHEKADARIVEWARHRAHRHFLDEAEDDVQHARWLRLQANAEESLRFGLDSHHEFQQLLLQTVHTTRVMKFFPDFQSPEIDKAISDQSHAEERALAILDSVGVDREVYEIVAQYILDLFFSTDDEWEKFEEESSE